MWTPTGSPNWRWPDDVEEVTNYPVPLTPCLAQQLMTLKRRNGFVFSSVGIARRIADRPRSLDPLRPCSESIEEHILAQAAVHFDAQVEPGKLQLAI